MFIGRVISLEATRFLGRNVIRNEQFQVAEDFFSKYAIKNAFLIETDDLKIKCNDYCIPMSEDDVHLGIYGILTLGELFSECIYRKYKRIDE